MTTSQTLVVSLAVLLGGYNFTFGQASPGTDLEQEEITVVGTYKPHLADAVKVNPSPSLPESENKSLEVQNYQVPLYLRPIPWQAPVVKPVALGKPTLQPLPNLFAKLGFGTQFSPLVEAAYSSGRSEKFNYGFRGGYTSSNGARENQRYTQAGGALFGKYFLGPVVLGFDGEVQSESVFFYGYNEEDTSFQREDVRQRFLRTGAVLEVANSQTNDLGLEFGLKGGIQTQADVFDGRETRPFVETVFRYPLASKDEIRLFTGFEGLVYRGPLERNRGMFRFRPGYAFNRDDFFILAGLEVATDTGRFLLFPDLEFNAKLLDKELVFFAGWNMRLQTNSWRTLTDANPFLADSIGFRNSRVEDRYAGVRGEYEGRIGYEVKLSQKPINDFALFVNDTADTRRFQVLYEDVTLWVAHAEVSYQGGERYRAFASLDLRNFSETGDQARAWHEPGLLWNLGGRYKATEKLHLKADILGMGPTWAKMPDGSETKLKGTADINLGATYAVNKYFTAWADVNNLASFKHQRYYLYPSYGFRFMAGLQFSF